MNKSIKLILNFFIYIFIIIAITTGLPKFLSWYLKTPYPMATITSGSMWPVLKEGDLIFIQGIKNKEDININDIVIYRNKNEGAFIIHRAVALGENTLTTKGDANFTKDTPVSYEDVIGKTFKVLGYNFRIPSLGFITLYANKK